MELRVIGLNFLYAILGVVLMFGAYRVIDMLTPSVDFQLISSSWPNAMWRICGFASVSCFQDALLRIRSVDATVKIVVGVAGSA